MFMSFCSKSFAVCNQPRVGSRCALEAKGEGEENQEDSAPAKKCGSSRSLEERCVLELRFITRELPAGAASGLAGGSFAFRTLSFDKGCSSSSDHSGWSAAGELELGADSVGHSGTKASRVHRLQACRELVV